MLIRPNAGHSVIFLKRKEPMQTRLTTWDVALQLAERAGITPEQVKAILQAQAELAYENVDAGYPIAGIGILAKLERPARKMVMRFGPRQGQEVTIPAKRVLKFHISKIAKDTVFRTGAIPPDVSTVDLEIDAEPAEGAE